MDNIDFRAKIFTIVDKIVIFSIYGAILLDEPNLVIKSCFLFSTLICLSYIFAIKKVSQTILVYIGVVISSFSFLLLIGLLKGNNFSDSIKFIYPLAYLFNIFVYSELCKTYKLERYIQHYYYAGIFLSIKIILLFYLFENNLLYDYLPIYNANLIQATWIANSTSVTRVFVGQATIIPISLLFAYYLKIGNKKISILILITSLGVVFTQTAALWLVHLFIILYIITKMNNFLKVILLYFTLFLILFLILFMNFNSLSLIIDEKFLYSVPVKFAQIYEVINELNDDLIFGGGLGHVFSNGSNTIEVVILHILSSTGILGFIVYSYMFFYFIIVSFPYCTKDKQIKILSLSFLTIVVLSFSNPYLLGGTSGLFLIPLIAVRYLQLKKILTN